MHLQKLLAHLVTFPFLLAPHETLIVHLWAPVVASPAEADVAAGVALVAILWVACTALGTTITIAILAR